jgi:hypothetical protein
MVLILINDCVQLHQLPTPGGILDQDALFMDIFHHVQQTRAIREDMDSKKATKK